MGKKELEIIEIINEVLGTSDNSTFLYKSRVDRVVIFLKNFYDDKIIMEKIREFEVVYRDYHDYNLNVSKEELDRILLEIKDIINSMK